MVIRYFAFLDDGSIRPIPIRVMDGLARGYDWIPDMADKALRVVEVILALKAHRHSCAVGLYPAFRRTRRGAEVSGS